MAMRHAASNARRTLCRWGLDRPLRYRSPRSDPAIKILANMLGVNTRMAILTKDIDRVGALSGSRLHLPITGSNEGALITMGLIAIVHPGGQPLRLGVESF